MRFLKTRGALVAALTLLVVSMLGASLGVAMANQRNITLSPGFNLMGGPLFANIEPDDFMECFPDGSWEAIYIWDAENQSWSHYFAEGQGLPGYINHEEVGGIDTIPRLSGLVVIMNTQVTNPFVPDDTSQVGNCQ